MLIFVDSVVFVLIFMLCVWILLFLIEKKEFLGFVIRLLVLVRLYMVLVIIIGWFFGIYFMLILYCLFLDGVKILLFFLICEEGLNDLL